MDKLTRNTIIEDPFDVYVHSISASHIGAYIHTESGGMFIISAEELIKLTVAVKEAQLLKLLTE